MMRISDKEGTCVFLNQVRSGKIIIPVGNIYITLSKEDAEKFTLYDIDGFDVDLYKQAYKG